MKKSYATILKVFAGVFIALFLIFQLYNTLYNPLTTETAVHFSTYDGVALTGYSIRSDVLLPDSGGGVKSYVAKNGEKVAKNSVIANIYNDTSTAANVSRIAEIDEQLSSLKELKSFSDQGSADLTVIDAQISEAYKNVLTNSFGSRFKNVNELCGELLSLMNRKQIATGQASDFSSLITSLESERNSLLTSGASPARSIVADTSGYFVADWDGYENVLTPDMIDTVNPETLDSIKPQTGGSYIGKMVSDFSWYIAANVSFEDSLMFAEGNELYLRTSLSTVTDLPVTVYKINKGISDEKVTVIFECKYMNGELASVRSQPMTAIINESEGLKISNGAIRIVDGVRGVYVVSGMTAKFRTVDILYSEDGYSICSMNNADSNALSLYDEVIVKGKNLYEGKIIG